MPTLRSLECLVAVVELGSLTAAAEALHVTQSALSHQVRVLERELGGPVVERLPRGVRPTILGTAVLADARAALRAAERVEQTARDVRQGTAGVLRVGCAQSLTASVLAPALRRWTRRRASTPVEVVEASSADDLVAALESDRIGLAIGPQPTRWDGSSERIGSERVVVVGAGPGSDGPITWPELASRRLVGYEHGSGLASWLDARAREHGVTLDVGTRVSLAGSVASLATGPGGLGAGIVPTSALETRARKDARPLEPPLSRDLWALTRTPSDPVVRGFVRVVRRVVEPLGKEG